MESTGKTDKGENKRTDIAQIGKKELIRRLFEGTGYENCRQLEIKPLEIAQTEENGCKSSNASVMNTSASFLEGVDFDLVYTPLKHLGYKVVLGAIGHLYAAMHQPQGIMVKLAISQRFCAEDIVLFFTGVVAAAKEHSIKQIGFDLLPSCTGMNINISALGISSVQSAKPDKNSLLCLTGNLGAAFMGLHVLEREKVAFNKIPADKVKDYVQPDLSKYKYVLSQYLQPEINPKTLNQFKEAGIIPCCGRFITKGLAESVLSLCEQWNLGARVYLNKIPIAAQTFEMAEEINMEATTAALNGGDDYKFLFVIPLSEHEHFHREFPNVDIIGHFTEPGAGAAVVTPEGNIIEIKSL